VAASTTPKNRAKKLSNCTTYCILIRNCNVHLLANCLLTEINRNSKGRITAQTMQLQPSNTSIFTSMTTKQI